MQDILSYSIFNNTALGYCYALGYFVIGAGVVHVFKRYIVARLKKWSDATETTLDDLVVKVVRKSLLPVAYLGVLYISLHTLTLSAEFKDGLRIAVIIALTVLVVRAIVLTVDFALQSSMKVTLDAERREKQLRGIRGLLKFLIWAIALVFLLDNLGIKISAVVAGLGIGGIAVALAAQAVLGDLFSYFVIFFDKPFEIGDFIVVGDKMGAVEHIGIKTTRIRALSGEQLVFSNTDLTNSRVHNFKKMERRRVLFKLGVIYQTTAAQLKLIPEIVKEIIVKQSDATFDRGHFAAFGDFSLDFEFVYYVISADYNKYMDIQQDINFSIFSAFEQAGIEFAYPSQTLFINKINQGA